MTTDSSAPPSVGPRGAWHRAATNVVHGARASAPTLRRWGSRVGDFLVTISWRRFFLLALLLLVLGSVLSATLFGSSPVVVVEHGEARDRVQVEIKVGPEGLRIQPRAPGNAPPGAAEVADRDGQASIRITDQGVQIVGQREGKDVTVAIDAGGVRVTEGTAPPAADRARQEGNAVILPPALVRDPATAAAAVEAARAKIEEIVSDQVQRQVERSTGTYLEERRDGLLSFVVLLIVGAIVVKVVLGSKKKAEVRAQAASAEAAEQGLKRQLAEAQLKMMQAQVEPHFLFNTLASVDYLIETDPARASAMQKNLIQYLRAALPQMREGSTTLGKELALCRAFLQILKVRMDERLQYVIEVPAGLGSARFPPMMLQSLVENAIKHGLEPKPEGGSLTIGASVADGVLHVSVADSGLGFGAAAQPGTGVGLANVRERLAALYGAAARLRIESPAGGGTIATIEVPYAIDTGGLAPEAGAAPAA